MSCLSQVGLLIMLSMMERCCNLNLITSLELGLRRRISIYMGRPQLRLSLFLVIQPALLLHSMLPDLERLLGRVKASVGSSCTIVLPFIGEKILKQRVCRLPSSFTGCKAYKNFKIAEKVIDWVLAMKIPDDNDGLPDIERDFLEEPACPKILCDIFESCIGAILVDTGFNLKLVWKIMLGLLEPALTFSTLQLNQVRELRELCQYVDLPLRLPKPLKKEGGYFVTVEVDVKDKTLTFSAVNNNSKTAQKMAAQ